MDELSAEIERIKEEKKLIVVEGKKDVAALNRLGITRVKTLSKRPLVLIAEEIANETDECVLLVDLDAEGRKIYMNLRHHLNQLGVKIDTRFRNFLYRKTKLRCIEGLDTYVENNTEK
jgi:5S rRNA maturation endonuclease (ribonuclease M5)